MRKGVKAPIKKFKIVCDVCNKVFSCQLSDITKVDWCKNLKSNRYLPFDFIIEERKIIIELDGKQHFEQIGKWLSPEETRINDLYKMKCANENGFSVIRILQKDIYFNKYDWLKELCENIEKNSNEKIVQNIYMCKKNEYKDFNL